MDILVKEFRREFEILLKDIEKTSQLLESQETDPENIVGLRTLLIRAAAPIEQCFSGLTTRLWDDPFEWTLPEYISDPARVAEYIEEVKSVVGKGFRVIDSDDVLSKSLPAPEEMTTILVVLVRTLSNSRSVLAVLRDRLANNN